MVYQMIIEAKDPGRHVPGSWNFYRNPGDTVWKTALDIAEKENVTLLRIVDEQGHNVPQGE